MRPGVFYDQSSRLVPVFYRIGARTLLSLSSVQISAGKSEKGFSSVSHTATNALLKFAAKRFGAACDELFLISI